MMELGNFLKYLQEEELGNKPKGHASLISKWKDAEAKKIRALISSTTKRLKGSSPKGFRSAKSNQGIGNLMHKHFVNEFNAHAPIGVKIVPCKGSGYPDNLLTITKNNKTKNYCVEFKATSDWNPKDSNRRVLMSSTTKIRSNIAENLIPANPLHILITIKYVKGSGKIDGLRLDFLDPKTQVNTRLEASTTHKLLHGASHKTSNVFG